MAVLDGHHDAGDSADPVGSALGKIVRVLSEPVAAQVEVVRRTTAPAPDRAAARPDPETTTVLVQACSSHQRVRLDYRTEAGSERVLGVDPWAVVVRHGRWYLLCWSHRADAVRAYRIDRVRSVERLDGTFTPPADLDPVALLEEHLAVGWEYEVEVLVEAPLEVATRSLPRAIGRLEPVGDTACRLTGSTSDAWWYARQLAALPWAYRVVRGPELQEATRVIAQRMLSASTGGDGPTPSVGAPA